MTQEIFDAVQVNKSDTQAAFKAACEKHGVAPTQATFDIWQDARGFERTLLVGRHIPENFTTHRAAWRDALVKARDNAPAKTVDSDEAGYWQHELDAYDRSFSRLLDGEPKQVTTTQAHEPASLSACAEAPNLGAILQNLAYRDALQSLAQCDGSSANVSNAEVLAKRVRLVATQALAVGPSPVVVTAPGALLNADEEVVVKLTDGWSIRSGGSTGNGGSNLVSGDYVRVCRPDGSEYVYWNSLEWHNDPEGVMGAMLNAAAGYRPEQIGQLNPEAQVK